MNPVRLVTVSLVAALTLTAASASADGKPTKTTNGAAAKPKTATPKKKAPKKAQPAPQKLEEPVAPPVEVAESLPPPPAPAPTVAPVAEPVQAVAKDEPVEARHKEYAFNDRPFTVAPLLGYATNGLNVGVGLRAGYTLPSKIYIGASFMYQHGTSVDGGIAGYNYSSHTFGFYPSAEVGYEFQISAWTLRPYGGLGILFSRSVSSSTGLDGQNHDVEGAVNALAFYPGFSALYNIPNSPGFIGGDARILIANGTSFGMFATGGIRF